MSRSRAYDAAVRAAAAVGAECIHQVTAGDLVRPWCGTPVCALCRRRHPVHWRRLNPDAPLPRNVVPIAGTRKLF